MKYQESLDLLNQATGVGLCVCRNLVRLMGGDIYLDDDDYDSGIPNCPGTRFTIALNQEPIAEEYTSIAFRTISSGTIVAADDATTNNNNSSNSDFQSFSLLPDALSILFVDDDVIIRKMFSRAVKRVAPTWKVQEASNGETALSMVRDSLTAADPIDLIFMDQYMASIEKQLLGTETVRQLRADGFRGIICGLSANDKHQEFLQAGANAFLLKPLHSKKDELTRTLRGLLSLQQQQQQQQV